MFFRGRVRSVVLLLVAAMALSAVAVGTTTATAQNQAAADNQAQSAAKKAKKKAKKCKKGYVKKTTKKTVKKNGKKVTKKTTKCVKKKAKKKKASALVESVTVDSVDRAGLRALSIDLTVNLKKLPADVKFEVTITRGEAKKVEKLTKSFTTGELQQKLGMRIAVGVMGTNRALSKHPFKVTIVADGVKSNVFTTN